MIKNFKIGSSSSSLQKPAKFFTKHLSARKSISEGLKSMGPIGVSSVSPKRKSVLNSSPRAFSTFKKTEIKNHYSKPIRKSKIFSEENKRVQQAQLVFWASQKKRELDRNKNRRYGRKNKAGLVRDNTGGSNGNKKRPNTGRGSLSGRGSLLSPRVSTNLGKNISEKTGLNYFQDLVQAGVVDKFKIQLESEIMRPSMKSKTGPARHFSRALTNSFRRKPKSLYSTLIRKKDKTPGSNRRRSARNRRSLVSASHNLKINIIGAEKGSEPLKVIYSDSEGEIDSPMLKQRKRLSSYDIKSGSRGKVDRETFGEYIRHTEFNGSRIEMLDGGTSPALYLMDMLNMSKSDRQIPRRKVSFNSSRHSRAHESDNLSSEMAMVTSVGEASEAIMFPKPISKKDIISELLGQFDTVCKKHKKKDKQAKKFVRGPRNVMMTVRGPTNFRHAISSQKQANKFKLSNKMQRIRDYKKFIDAAQERLDEQKLREREEMLKKDLETSFNRSDGESACDEEIEKQKEILKRQREQQKKRRKRNYVLLNKNLSKKKMKDRAKRKKQTTKIEYELVKAIKKQVNPALIGERDRIRLNNFSTNQWILTLLSKFGKNHRFTPYEDMNVYGQNLIQGEIRRRVALNKEWKDLRYQFYYSEAGGSKYIKVGKKGAKKSHGEELDEFGSKYDNLTRVSKNKRFQKIDKAIKEASKLVTDAEYTGNLAYSTNIEINRVFQKTYPNIHPQNLKAFMNIYATKEDFEEHMKRMGIVEKRRLQDYKYIHFTMKRMIQEVELMKRANYYITKGVLDKWGAIVEESKKRKRRRDRQYTQSYIVATEKVRNSVWEMLDFQEKCKISLQEIHDLGLLKYKKRRNRGIQNSTVSDLRFGMSPGKKKQKTEEAELLVKNSKASKDVFEIIPSNNFKLFYESFMRNKRVTKFSLNADGQTFLHYSLLRASFTMISQILKMKLDIDGRDTVSN